VNPLQHLIDKLNVVEQVTHARETSIDLRFSVAHADAVRPGHAQALSGLLEAK
jgi:hypothetical protein